MSVKRYTYDFDYDYGWSFYPESPVDRSGRVPVDMVRASDYDAACAERDALKARLEELTRALVLSCNALDHLAFNIGRDDGEAMTRDGAASFASAAWDRSRAALSPQAEKLEKEGV